MHILTLPHATTSVDCRMRYLLIAFLFVACQPETVQPNPTPQTQQHTITEKFYSASTGHIQRTVNNVDNGLLVTFSDTVYVTNSTVTFQIEHPQSGSYILTPCINENYPVDTCSVELWIDGIMVAQDGNYGSAGISYSW